MTSLRSMLLLLSWLLVSGATPSCTMLDLPFEREQERDLLLGGATAADRDAVLGIVQTSFDAIAEGDSEAWREVLLPEGHFSSVRDANDGTHRIGLQTFEAYLAQGGDPDGGYLERFWDPVVLIDGDVATVWTRYDFHIQGSFSHCGTDVIVLLRTNDGWKIASLAWTVERDGCEESPLGPVAVK